MTKAFEMPGDSETAFLSQTKLRRLAIGELSTSGGRAGRIGTVTGRNAPTGIVIRRLATNPQGCWHDPCQKPPIQDSRRLCGLLIGENNETGATLEDS